MFLCAKNCAFAGGHQHLLLGLCLIQEPKYEVKGQRSDRICPGVVSLPCVL